MKLNNYVPNIYNNNVEINALINAEENHFENILKFQIRNSFENNFINTADSDGLARFEILFNITANLETETIEFRRQRLWNRINSNPLYTERYLAQKLDEILKPGNWSYEIDYNNYKLDIYSLRPGKLWLNELRALLQKIMPCNIVWTIHIFAITWEAVKDNTDKWEDLMTKNLTWQQVMEGEWIDE